MAGMKVNLTVMEGTDKGKVFSFDEPENFLLGRSADKSKEHLLLSPDDTYVSRNHFLLEINPPDCFIRDAGSLNGTFIMRASEKTVFYLSGRSEDKETYSLMADRLQKQLSFKSFVQIDNRLPLQDKDIIKVGRTEISVNVVKEKSSSGGYQISLVYGAEELSFCIECNKKITRKPNLLDARKLSSDDYVCDACLKKAQLFKNLNGTIFAANAETMLHARLIKMARQQSSKTLPFISATPV